MLGPFSYLKSSKLWYIGLPGSLLLLAIIAGYSILGLNSRPQDDQTPLGEGRELVSVQKRTFIKVVPVKGSLVFPNTVELTFDTQGKVGEILVQEGEHVVKGQPLAKLDRIAVTKLNEDVARAQYALDRAEENLEKANEEFITTPLELAEFEETKARAGLALDHAQDALADFQRDHDRELAQVRQARADAELVLDRSQEALASFDLDHDQELATARRVLAKADIALDKSEQSLADFDLDRAQELAASRGAATKAKVVLNKAGEDLADFEFTHADRLADARKAVANADVGLDDAREELADFYLDYDQELATARHAKAVAEVALGKAEDIRSDFFFSIGNTVAFNDEAVKEMARLRAAKALARANLNKARDDLATLEPGADSRKLQQLESAVEAAIAKLDGALQDLRVLEEGHEVATRQQLEAAMELAQINLTKAQDDLADLGNEPARLDLHDLEVDVEQSLASLAKAQDDLAKLEEGPDPLERLKLEATAQMAMANLAQANDDLNELLDGPDLQELALREKKVAKQHERLVDLTDGPEVLEVALREAQVATALAVLEDTLENLQGASITAPFAGVISLVNVEVDDEVDDESRVIEIVDPTAIQVKGFVDAADIRFVRKGSLAKVTIDALPGQVMEVTVSSVAAEPRTERGVVRYPITITIKPPQGVEVPVGLSGVSSEVLYEEKGVLSMPQGALYRTSKQTMVKVMNDGFVEERAVIPGDGDGYWVEVLQGLEEGDQVVVDTTPVASTRIGLR